MGVLLGACSVPSAEMSADYPAYESLEEAVGASDAVIHGRYLSFKEVEMLPEINPTEGDATTNPYYGVDPATVDTSGMGVPTTVSSVEVVEVIAGDLRPGMVIEIRQMGNRDIRETSTVFNRYIMGQAAYLTYDDVYLILVVVAIVCFIFIKLYPKIELVLFDKVFAQSIGIHTTRISNIVLGLCLLTICIGIKTVGIILISSMLVTPAIAALQWTKHYRSTVILSVIIGMSCTLAGTYISTVVSDFATGPVIVLCQTSCALFSIICSPNGVVRRSLKRKGGEHV